MRRITQYTRFIVRSALACLLVFELLNWVAVLHYSLDFTWRGLVITSAGLWTMVEGIIIWQQHHHRRLHITAMLAITCVLLYMDAFGDIFRWYGAYPWYDQIAHFVGGFGGGLMVLFIGYGLVDRDRRSALHNFLAVCVVTFFAVIYELGEYFEDYFTGSNRLGDGFDTANDLFLGIIGAAIAVALLRLVERKKRADK